MKPVARLREITERQRITLLICVAIGAIIWIGFHTPVTGQEGPENATPGSSPQTLSTHDASPATARISTPVGRTEASPRAALPSGAGPTTETQEGRVRDTFPGLFREYPSIEDPDRLLSNSQRKILSGDATRLNRHGIPTLIMFRESDNTRAESTTYANAVRSERNIESADGADNGLLILVTINPEAPRSGSLVVSYGANTLPKGRLTPDSIERVYEVSMLPLLQRGKIYEATRLGVRLFIYLETYYPDPQTPVSGVRESLHKLAVYAGPVLVAVFGAGFILNWLSQRGSAWNTDSVRRRITWLSLVACGLLFVGGVYVRSGAAIASGILIGIMIGFHLLLPDSSKIRRKRRRIKARTHGRKDSTFVRKSTP